MKPPSVLMVAGTLGFVGGMFRVPTLQVAVESSQVLAGIVRYPAGNAFYIYHTKVWTLLHQIPALLLYAGVPELAMSYLLSGLLGMAALQALAIVIYAFSRNVILAVGAATVIVLTGVAEGSSVYPVSLMGTDHTYGALGLSLFVLVLGLYGAGYTRSAAFLLGVAPAVHPSLGVWLWAVVSLTLLWEGRPAFARAAGVSTFFVAGCVLTAVSLAVQRAFITDVPNVNPEEVARYFAAFVALWDSHRAPVPLLTEPMAFNVAAMAAATAGLAMLRRSIPEHALFFLRAVVVCGVLGILAVFVSWIPPQHLPETLVILMPSRLLVINTMVLIAMVVGLIASLPQTSLTRIAPAALLVACGIYQADVVLERARWPEVVRLKDYSNDPLFAAAAAEQKGLLLSGGSLHLSQLQTRRPVLLDGGGLDALPYAAESGPEMQRVLLGVYGIDLLNPPPDAVQAGVIPDEFTWNIWTHYSRARWQEIRRTYNVTQVLTASEWILDLPLVAENATLRLYRIPE